MSSITLSCKEKAGTKQKKVNTKRDNHFLNITRVIQLGDSVRIEIEDRTGMAITHYIDLKGTSDDGFNNSYNVICTYTEEMLIQQLFSKIKK